MKLPAWLYRLRPLLGVVILIAGWALIHAAGAVDPVLLPSPAEAASAFWNGMTQGTLGADFGKTIVRTLSSFAIALVVAVPLGIVLGASQRLYESIEFAIDFFRSTPASAMCSAPSQRCNQRSAGCQSSGRTARLFPPDLTQRATSTARSIQ